MYVVGRCTRRVKKTIVAHIFDMPILFKITRSFHVWENRRIENT